jgi:hypothetical protein
MRSKPRRSIISQVTGIQLAAPRRIPVRRLAGNTDRLWVKKKLDSFTEQWLRRGGERCTPTAGTHPKAREFRYKPFKFFSKLKEGFYRYGGYSCRCSCTVHAVPPVGNIMAFIRRRTSVEPFSYTEESTSRQSRYRFSRGRYVSYHKNPPQTATIRAISCKQVRGKK